MNMRRLIALVTIKEEPVTSMRADGWHAVTLTESFICQGGDGCGIGPFAT
jgi:hypothetical protein